VGEWQHVMIQRPKKDQVCLKRFSAQVKREIHNMLLDVCRIVGSS
jgi:hypothetical protein